MSGAKSAQDQESPVEKKSGIYFSIDRGGTFTDVYAEYFPDACSAETGAQTRVIKLLSSDPAHYADAPTEGIRRVLQEFYPEDKQRSKVPGANIRGIRMGTTVATNALLERKGAETVLVTTKGFGDLLDIGNQARPQIFDLTAKRPELLFKTVIEASERVRVLTKANRGIVDVNVSESQVSGRQDFSSSLIVEGATGEQVQILQPLDEAGVRKDLQRVFDSGVRSVAVVLVHSYAFRDHERAIGDIARKVGFTQISLSSELAPMVKVVPRGQTCCVDAYLTPLITEYLQSFVEGFDADLDPAKVQFMMSDGGLCRMQDFHGFKAILSGPAAGVVGYSRTTLELMSLTQSRAQAVIGFDMGGTSTDVSRVGSDGRFEHVYDTLCAGVVIQAPQIDINTVAAGGGSLLKYIGGLMQVGPESAGAHPGPVCYRKGGQLAVTDANVVLGRVLPEYFPKIFGKNEDEPLDKDGSFSALALLCDKMNRRLVDSAPLSVADCALGFIKVANTQMCRPIRSLTEAKGYAARNHALACFGGAGGQHACAIARDLGMKKVFVHRYAGILSAYGLSFADLATDVSSPVGAALLCAPDGSVSQETLKSLQSRTNDLWMQTSADSSDQGVVVCEVYLNLRYDGTDTALMILQEPPSSSPQLLEEFDFVTEFKRQYKREYGFLLENRAILVDDIRIRAMIRNDKPVVSPHAPTSSRVEDALLKEDHQCFFEGPGWMNTPVYRLSSLPSDAGIAGPAILIDNTSTILLEPDCRATICVDGSVKIDLGDPSVDLSDDPSIIDPVQLAVFSNRFMAIAEQMGKTLQRTSISTNIKERLDFSCALFSPDGGLVANAPHLPVHLGAMQEAVRWQIRNRPDWSEGEVLLSNSPTAGGSHLPDMTVITPVYGESSDGTGAQQRVPIFYVASRGHHADIGGISPGSMPPFSKALIDEGAAIDSFLLVSPAKNNFSISVFDEPGISAVLMAAGSRNLADNLSDLQAQVAANNRGIALVGELCEEYSLTRVHAYMAHVQSNAEAAVRELLGEVARKHGTRLEAEDFMDDGSVIHLCVTIENSDDPEKTAATFDFAGTSEEIYGNVNAPRAVTVSAVIYCLRAMVSRDIPLNQGCLTPIDILVPEGCFLNPGPTAAVVGGNVLTSQRVTDVILEAFAAAANSQGCMNNLTFGDATVGYYETIAGGAGAGPTWDGVSATQVHMTNTRITDAEVLERRYPVMLREFSIRRGSGGRGMHPGGNGVVRELEFLADNFNFGILSERRAFAPRGIQGGEPAARGRNLLIRGLKTYETSGTRVVSIGGKNEISVNIGDRIRIETPGGGGYGKSLD